MTYPKRLCLRTNDSIPPDAGAEVRGPHGWQRERRMRFGSRIRGQDGRGRSALTAWTFCEAKAMLTSFQKWIIAKRQEA